MTQPAHLTERQAQWFASGRASLQGATGRSLEEWAALASACPETAHRKRLAWMKQHYGLGQNYASLVLNAAFPPVMGWDEPQALEAALWKDEAARGIFDALRREIVKLPDVVVGQRKGFTGFSRGFQFAAARPVKATLRLGLAVPPEMDSRLQAAGKEGWSERLHAALTVESASAVADLPPLLHAAWARS